MRIVIFLFLATLLSTSHANFKDFNPLHLLRHLSGLGGDPIRLLRLLSGLGGFRDAGLDCLSWRLAVETNNLRNWNLVPKSCEGYIGNYILGDQYRHDCELVAESAIEYAEGLRLGRDGKDIWVFDIDETTLSNLPYYARTDIQFGTLPYNSTKFDEWVVEGKAPSLPAVLRLYKKLLSLGFKAVFLTGTEERFRDVRIANLRSAGYDQWEKLILKGEADKGSAVVYKSKKRTELVKKGYRILGNIGDQWSDLLGDNVGSRTFKVPDPLYYIP